VKGIVIRALTLFDLIPRTPWDRWQGKLGAAFVLGGVDVTGAHLYTVYQHGR
jgi:hypothetical protein